MADIVSTGYAALWNKFVADVCAVQPWNTPNTVAGTEAVVLNKITLFFQSLTTAGYLKVTPNAVTIASCAPIVTYNSGVATMSQPICDIGAQQSCQQYVTSLYMSQNGLTGTVPAKLQAGRDAVTKFNDAYATMYADKDKRKVITDQLATDIVAAGFASLDEFYAINQAFRYV